FSESFDKCPVHRWVGRADSVHVDAFEHRALADWAGRLAGSVTRPALAEIFWPSASVRLAVATRRIIHRQQHHSRTRGFHAPQQLFACLPLTWRIELIPDRTAERFVDTLDRSGCHRGKALQCPASAGGTSNRQFTIREKRSLSTRRT